jgi:hypothetical protein
MKVNNYYVNNYKILTKSKVLQFLSQLEAVQQRPKILIAIFFNDGVSTPYESHQLTTSST